MARGHGGALTRSDLRGTVGVQRFLQVNLKDVAVGGRELQDIDLRDFEPTPGPRVFPLRGVCTWASFGVAHVAPLLLWKRWLAQKRSCTWWSLGPC